MLALHPCLRCPVGALLHRPPAAPLLHQLPPPGVDRWGLLQFSLTARSWGCICVRVATGSQHALPLLLVQHAAEPHVAPAAADTHERLASLCPSPDGRLLLAAGTSGLVTLRRLHSLQVCGGWATQQAASRAGSRWASSKSAGWPSSLPRSLCWHALPKSTTRTTCLQCSLSPALFAQVVLRYDAGRGPITALAITPEGCFLAGECGGRHWAAAQYRCASGVLAVAPRAGSHQSHTSSCPLCCHAAGTAEGSLVLFAPDPRRRITRRFNLAA